MVGLMLAVLAAIVPIVASLYVAGSMLSEYAHRDYINRVVERISLRESAERKQIPFPEFSREHVRKSQEIHERRRMLLRANGIDPDSLGRAKLDSQVMPPIPSRVERRRQWVLLLGSAIGVVLLAIDLAL